MNWYGLLALGLGIALVYMAITGKYQLTLAKLASTPLTPVSGGSSGGGTVYTGPRPGHGPTIPGTSIGL